MKPVAIFRHAPVEGPAYFAIFLERHGIPWRLVAIDEGEAVPATAEEFSGLCFMGGPMSVNDPLPWIEPACALIRDATVRALPVIGHCLGGQLLAKALGAAVTRNPVKEIGWGAVRGENHAVARHWLGEHAGQSTVVFHWHGETFALPSGASRLFASRHCANQMFALGPHLAMQCHVEMTPEMIANWCGEWGDEVAAIADRPAMQAPDAMLGETAGHLPAMRRLADQIYSVWSTGLRR
jgi:GMP synthase-like glutamine amidotransferase